MAEVAVSGDSGQAIVGLVLQASLPLVIAVEFGVVAEAVVHAHRGLVVVKQGWRSRKVVRGTRVIRRGRDIRQGNILQHRQRGGADLRSGNCVVRERGLIQVVVGVARIRR